MPINPKHGRDAPATLPYQPTQNREVSSEQLLKRRERFLPRFPFSTWAHHKAWLVSCLFHTGLFLTLAILFRPAIHGSGGELDRPIGIALAYESGDGSDYFLAGGSAPGNSNASSESPSATLEKLTATPTTISGATSLEELVSGLLPSAGETSGSSSSEGGLGTGISGTGTGNLSGSGTGGGKGLNKTTTQFLGVAGTGSSFVYVLDRSDSMNTLQGSPLRLAKQELLNSIESLGEGNQFQVVFYNSVPNVLTGARGGKNRLLYADSTEKSRAEQFIRGMIANGGTEHAPALRIGLSFAPDVLFFMTDGERPGMTEAELLDIQRRASIAGTTIHTIQFQSGAPSEAGGWIQTLAKMTRGTYRYVDIDALSVER